MNLRCLSLSHFVNKVYLRQGIIKSDFELFNIELKNFAKNLNEKESEERNKNIIASFLETRFSEKYKINTSEKIDLVICHKNSDNIGVIIETKSLKNNNEFPTKDNINVKAFHELILYYLRERDKGNDNIKNLIITNGREWFLFDVEIFYKNFL